MTFFRRLFGGSSREPPREGTVDGPPEARTPRLEPAVPALVAELRVLQGGAPAEALAALDRLRGTPHEVEALAALARAAAADELLDPLRVAGAALHVDRGERDAALALLEGVALPAGVLLAADLRAERGEVARAVTLVERVLARDIDAPGARERHARWRRELGVVAPGQGPAAEATVLRADAPVTDLTIVGEAGRGGAGTVYEAVDEVLGRRVALKVYHQAASERSKLEREARTAVEVADVGIVRVFDADPARGYIAMEWLAGGSLKALISARDTRRLAAYPRWYPRLVAILAGLHGRGVLHADLKPANVLFRDGESPVLSDFGLAQRPGALEAAGSLGYLSPERVAGQPLTLADDVFALGRILEDVLDVLGGDPSPAASPWRRLARRAVADEGARPRHAAALLAELAELCPMP